MLVTFTMETLLNSATFACVMPTFPVGIVDYTRACTEMLSIIRVEVVEKVFQWPVIRLLKVVIPMMVPTSLHSPLLTVEFTLFLGHPFHIDRGVVHVFAQGVVSYRHLLLEPWVKLGLE